MNSPKKKANVFIICTYLLLSFGAVLALFPFYWMIVTSLQRSYLFFTGLVPTYLTLENYFTTVKAYPVIRWYVNTVAYCVITIGSNLLLAMLGGYALSRMEFRGRDRLTFLVIGTMLVPPFLVLIPQYLIIVYFGLANTLLGLSAPFLVDAFNIFLVRQYMFSIPRELNDAARIDGCSDFQILTKIITPLCKPVVALVVTLTLLFRWNDFLWPLIVMTNSNNYVLTVGLSTLFLAMGVTNISATMVVATLSFVGPLAVFIVFRRYLVKGMLLTGIKA